MCLESADELLGQNWIEFWTGDDQLQARQALEDAKAGLIGRCQGYLPTAHGHPKWWDSVVTPINGKDGVPGGLLVISRDITEVHDLECALKIATARNDALIWATSEIVWRTDATQTSGNGKGWSDFTGQDHDSAAGDGWLDSVHPEDRARVKATRNKGVSDGTPYLNEYRLLHHGGEWRWVVDRAMPLLDEAGRITEWVGIISDIHARRTAEEALRGSEERLRLAIEASRVGIWDVDLDSGERVWSSELREILGLRADEPASERTLMDLVHPDDRAAVAAANRGVLVHGTYEGVTFRIFRPSDGQARWVLSKGKARLDEEGHRRRIGTLQDITAQKLADESLWAAANLDPLTSLPNRNLFREKLQQAISTASGAGLGAGLLVVDVDQFKEINDTLGHDVGDHVLKTIAGRLAALEGDTVRVGRLGGDEFAVLMHLVLDKNEVSRAAQELLTALARPITYESLELACSVSVGCATFPDDGSNGFDLLKSADLALYAAKGAGRNRYAEFRPSFRKAMEDRVGILRYARDALVANLIIPFYQPKMSLRTGRIVGFEALLRICDPEGVRTPASIFHAFQDPELAVKIGERMLDQVVDDILTWRASGLHFGSVALNVSAAEMSHSDVAARTLRKLAHSRLPAEVLQIEVTESVFLGNEPERLGSILRELDIAGVEVSLDDFGTGYASLTHLRNYPVKWLKVDRSFVKDIDSTAASAAIVRSVVGLSHALGMRVVAEGIETESELDFLRREGCDAGQGFLIAKAMSSSRVGPFLRNWSGMPAFASSFKRAG